MPSKILLIDGDPATTLWLQNKLRAEQYLVEIANRGDQGLFKIETDPPNLVVVDLVLPDMGGLDIIRHIRKNPLLVDIPIIVLSTRNDSNDIVEALHAGADHYVTKRRGADTELIGMIHSSLSEPKKKSTAIPSRGKIFSFCSAKGGTGTTSVCVNTAYALSKLDPKAQVVIVDMVFPIGSVGTSLGYATSKTMVGLTNEKDRVDRVLVERYVSHKLKWGFHVVLGANDPNEATSLNVSQIRPIFDMLRSSYDYILVDFGRALSRISLPILELSSAIVVIVTPDINTVKSTRLILQYLEAHDIDRQRLMIINNRTVGRVWTSTDDIERELSVPLTATIPYVVEYMTMAINAEVPFMGKFPEHSACLAFEEFAKILRTRLEETE